ncbi:MAG: GNAT family N-acetyltransferase [Chloroflexi bacterium]|nr:GNAT family N-acetyltransferase [Chloroflexota bacterium]
MSHQEYRNENYLISTDPAKQDVDAIHDFLKTAYWCAGIPREVVALSIQHSLPFGVFDGDQQIGLARIITDFATFAYLSDVYILDAYRGRGLSKWLMSCIMSHPNLQGLRRWSLATRDAHGLYRQFGFTALSAPERWMEIASSEIYKKDGGAIADNRSSSIVARQ